MKLNGQKQKAVNGKAFTNRYKIPVEVISKENVIDYIL